MKRIRVLFLVAMSVCLVIGCQKEDENSISTPTINTLVANIPHDGGVILSGELTQPNEITDHGFYFSEDSLFRNGNYVQISLDEPEKTGEFETIVETGLKKNTIYFFKAFITVEDKNIYGLTKPFISSGSKPPIIDFVLPEKAHLDDTITIFGKHFGNNNYYTSIYFNENKALLLNRSDSIITCMIPSSLSEYISTIRITVYDKSDSIIYSLHTPEIELINPLFSTFRDTITIYGSHFDNSIDRNRIELNNISAEIISSSRTQIAFVVPDELNDSSSIINLFSQLQWVNSEDEFKLVPPKIDSIPTCSYTNQHIMIEGSNFHPILHKNKIFIETIEAELISGDTKKLIINVPYGPFPRGRASIALQLANYEVIANSDFCILDPWLMISNTLPFSFYGDVGTFTIGNNAYVISDPIGYNNSEIVLWKFEVSSYSWTKLDVPLIINHYGTCTSNGNKGYLYNTGDSNNFWEYNSISNEWTQKADFPGDSRKQATSFAVGDNIFVGSGVSHGIGVSTQAYCDFYKYNPSTNTWSQVSDIAVVYCYKRYRASTFVIDDIAYLTAGASNTGMNDTWKYVSTTDEWIEVANFPDARHYTSSFSLNGKGYIANGTPVGGGERKECWEYNPLSNSWNQIDDIGHKSRFRGFAFTVSDTAYVGGGSGDDGVQDEIYKLVQ